MTKARTILTHAAAALVGAVALGAVHGVYTPAPDQVVTYALARDSIEGDAIRVDILDHGLSLDDCRAARPWEPNAYCMAEDMAPEATLVGYGCEGHAAPMFGEYEDDFPRCARIERIQAEG